MSRFAKSKTNVIYGMVYQMLYLALNFAVRVLILNHSGIEALSLNGLFREVLMVMSIAELGISSAISFSLYKPLATGDRRKVASVMRVFKKAYTAIGCVIFLIGLVMMPFLGSLINGMEVDMFYVRIVFFLFVLQTSVPYLFSYKTCLLNADQKNHIALKINILFRTVSFIIEASVLVVTGNFLAYLILETAYQILFNIAVAAVTDRIYPYLSDADPLPKEEINDIITNVRRMFVGKLSNQILNSTDNILISTLVSTPMVGIYSQYSMFINGFLRLFSQTNESIAGSIGNLLTTEKKEYCEEVFQNITWLFFAGGMFVSMCFFAGSSAFLQGFVGKTYLLEDSLLIISAMNMGFEIMKMPLWAFFNAKGMFKENQTVSLVGCIVNIIISIILGKMIGMPGIFIGTFVSLFIMFSYKLIVIYRQVFMSNQRKGYLNIGIYLVTMAGGLLLMFSVMKNTEVIFQNPALKFFINCIIASLVTAAAAFLPYIRGRRVHYVMQKVLKRGTR